MFIHKTYMSNIFSSITFLVLTDSFESFYRLSILINFTFIKTDSRWNAVSIRHNYKQIDYFVSVICCNSPYVTEVIE